MAITTSYSKNQLQALQNVISIVIDKTGVDFSHYKIQTFSRRLARRMELKQSKNIYDYVETLSKSTSEAEHLVKEMLIGVTRFMRDPKVWEQLVDEVFPELFAQQPKNGVLRVWCAGCSSGEEAYSLAICFKEALAKQLNPPDYTLQIFATDLNPAAISQARTGYYHKNICSALTSKQLKNYFIESECGYKICQEIRDMIIFAPHNLLLDPPFTRLDILSCRNLLIYLTPDCHETLLNSFHFSLKSHGFLLLGSSESLGRSTDLYLPLLTEQRRYSQIFRRLDIPILERKFSTSEIKTMNTKPKEEKRNQPTMKPLINDQLHSLTERLLLDGYTPAAVLVTESGNIIHIHGEIDNYLTPAPGKANWNILVMARESLRLTIRNVFHDALRLQKTTRSFIKQDTTKTTTPLLEISVQPLNDIATANKMLFVTFIEKNATGIPFLPNEQKIEEQYRDRIQFLDTNLRGCQQELQELKEEMQTSKEELNSSNEELQSTNEELTTSAEELRSMNEELIRTKSVSEKNLMRYTDLFDSAPVGYFDIDKQGIIRKSNYAGSKLLVTKNEICLGSRFSLFVIESERAVFVGTLKKSFNDRETHICEVSIWQQQGEAKIVQISMVVPKGFDSCRMVVVDISIIKRTQLALVEKDKVFRDMVDTIDGIVWEADATTFDFTFISQQAVPLLGYSQKDWRQPGFWASHLHPDDKSWAVEYCASCTGKLENHDFEYRFITKNGNVIWLHDVITVVADAGKPKWLRGIMVDITQRKIAEQSLRKSENRYARAINGSNEGIWDWNIQTGEDYLSPRWKQLLGFDEHELENHEDTFFSRLHPDDKSRVKKALDSHFEQQTAFNIDLRLLTKNSGYRWFHTAGKAEKDSHGQAINMAGSIADITDRKRINAREHHRSRTLELTNKGASIDVILKSIINGVEQENPDMLCSILLMDLEGKHLLTGVAPTLPSFYNQAIHGLAIGEGVGSCGTAAFMAKRVIVEDVQTHPFWQDYRELAASAKLASCWSEPIKNQEGKVLGTFAIYHHQISSPNNEDIIIIENAANLAAIAIERHQSREELQLASLVYDNSSEAMLVVGDDDKILSVNPAFTQITGYSAEEIIGKYTPLLNSEHHDSLFYEKMKQALNNSGFWQGEIWEKRKNGESFPEWLTINTIYTKDGDVHRRVALFSDITQKKKSQELIWKQANFDFLTGLPNRNMFHDRLQLEIKKSRRESISMAVLLIDLDQFKEVNDTLGHDMGDILLIEASKRISNCVRKSDTVARLGGDEFIIILSEIDEQSYVERCSQDILSELAEPFTLGQELTYISASIGITLYPNDSTEIDSLLKNADQAMYTAKKMGRNRYSYFTASMQQAAQERMRLVNDLRTAIDKQQFELFFQPIIDLSSQQVHKAEALIRWNHPTRGMVSPDEFIRIAEETGLIIEIGNWVFKQAVEYAKQLQQSYDENFQISINVSPVQFHNNSLGDNQYLDHIKNNGLTGDSIIVEITEGLLLEAGTLVAEQLLICKQSGIRVALDDFGTGYSSLSYLKKFDIDYIKIDRSFVANLTEGSQDKALCEAIIVMAHKLDIKVIAEGIETKQQQQLLFDAGCDYGQGYLFAKPMPKDEFEELIKQQTTHS